MSDWMAENMRRVEDYERRRARRALWSLPFNIVAGVAYGLPLAWLINAGETLTAALLAVSVVAFFAAQWIRLGPKPPELTPPPEVVTHGQ
jgi:hypothetical protein